MHFKKNIFFSFNLLINVLKIIVSVCIGTNYSNLYSRVGGQKKALPMTTRVTQLNLCHHFRLECKWVVIYVSLINR